MALHPWPVKKLGDVVADITVGHVGPMTAEYRSSGIPFLRSQNVRRLRIDPEGLCYIGEEFHAKLSKSRLQPGDVVVVRTGEPGHAAVVPGWLKDANCADLVIIRPGNSNPRFIAYFINSVTNGRIADVVVGAVQQHFNVGAARDLAIPLPSRKVQDGIAEVLGALDDKVELNQRMNRSLEELASAFFSSWFVDFDPVTAKRDGRTPIGVPAEAVNLFPSHFEESELGPIPKGWRTGRLGDVARNPRRPASPQDVECDTPYIGLEHMPRRSICLDRWGHAAEATSGKFSFREGNFLFGKLRPYFHKVGVAQADGVCSTDILVVEAHDPDYMSFVLGHLSSVEFIDYNDAGSGGTRMPRTSWDVMARFSLVIPPFSAARGLNAIVEPMIAQLKANSRENRTLAALRDTLLGPLLSGELTIKSAENAVGAAL